MNARHLHPPTQTTRSAEPRQATPNSGCPVCRGHLVADVYVDTIDAGGHVWVRALRCVQCRKIADAAGEPIEKHCGIHRLKRGCLTPQHVGDEVTPLGT